MATIQGVYVALFGRPADPTGLAYFNSVTNNGANLNAIGNLAASAEYQSRFSGQNNIQIINSIYQSLFGRDADLTGLTFFSNALAAGTLNINNVAIAILDGAQGTDKTIVTNKIAAADLYTKALDTGSEVVAYSGLSAAAAGRTFLTGVKDTVPTAAAVDAAVATMVSASVGGGTGTGLEFFLTDAGAGDVFGPNSAVAANKTTAGNDIFTARTNAQLQSVDVIDGGDGNDTLNAVMPVADTTNIKPLLRSVENVNLDFAKAANFGASVTFDASESTGINKLTASNVVIDTAADTLTLTGVNKATTVGLKDVTSGTIAGKVTVVFKDVAGTADTATISLEKVTAGTGSTTLTVADIEKLNIVSTGDANKVVVTAAAAKDFVITGDKALDLTPTGSTALKTVDASGLNASLTYAATGNGETITGGTKADVITLGAGADTVVYNATNASKLAAFDEIKSFDAGTGTTTVDKIDFKALALGSDTTIGSTVVNVGGDIGGFFSNISATTRIVFNDAADMLYVDVNKDGNFTAATDVAVKVTGVDLANLDKGDFILA